MPALPVERPELEYLRLHEIEPYLDACAEYYRPLAEFLIGSGARISEALALRFGRRRSRARRRPRLPPARPRGDETKADQGQAVSLRPDRPVARRDACATLRTARAPATTTWLFLCPPPKRGRYSGRTEPVPPSRKTAHDWHEAALEDAGLRDMPLHALRHTAAAAWLATGHPLIFVQRQLGHRSITTTEEHYGHLELSFVQEAVQRTEDAIAARRRRETISRAVRREAAAEPPRRRRPARRARSGAGSAWRAATADRRSRRDCLDPRLELARAEPNRTVRPAETDARDPAGLGGVVEPRARDAEKSTTSAA